MNKLLIILFFAVLISCQNGQQKTVKSNGETEWMDSNIIQQGPIIQDSLTFKQLENIEYLYTTFKEVDPTSLENWIEDFRRDQNPDREIEIWMMMANTYNTYLKNGDFDLEVKKEIFKIVLMRSSATEDEVIAHLELLHLSEKEARAIMQAYKLEAKPIRVIQE